VTERFRHLKLAKEQATRGDDFQRLSRKNLCLQIYGSQPESV